MGEHADKTAEGPRPGARRRGAVRLSSESLVRASYLREGQRLPLVVEPGAGGIDLAAWAADRREWVVAELHKHGALLFRGFGVDSPARFEQFIAATSTGPLEYHERTSPRSRVSGNVYTSTDYPPEHPIFLHNEQSYNVTFLRKIYFCCLRPADEGGETPLADTRRVFERIAPGTRRRFLEQGYTYVRNFGDGLGLPWQTAFQTTSRAAVERYCRDHDIEFEWKGGDRLRTRQTRPAAARHHATGEPAWFNHATFFHVSTLPPPVRDMLLEGFAEEDLPNNTYYGDGSPIEPEVLEELRAAYLAEKVVFPWRKGDVLLVDNVLASHGREPYRGPRRVVAGMADPFSWEDTQTLQVQP
jgi:alpha-ketoglutarate-dependent taurine dioxygenase